jgi:hypothetical protein
MDESYGEDKNVFAWSCLIATGSHWFKVERQWKLHLRAKNKELKQAGRPLISRYHASDCSGRHGEFKGWTRDERDAFVLGLFGILKRIPFHTIAFNTQLDELCEVFPEWANDRLDAAYGLLTTFNLYLIGQEFEVFAQHGRPPKITLFHDRTASDGKYDPTILRSFNRQITKPDFPYRDYFTTIAPMQWQQCIALQPADLVAFECFKQAQAKLAARQSRRSFMALLNMRNFGIYSKTFPKRGLLKLREEMVKAKVAITPN